MNQKFNRIEWATNVFLDAINSGTLAKGTCAACAVGNLVAAGQGVDLSKCEITGVEVFPMLSEGSTFHENYQWGNFCSTDDSRQIISVEALGAEKVIDQIALTHFTPEEIAQIEYAFETNTKIDVRHYKSQTKKEIRADQIKGLTAVLKVMSTFDEETPSKNYVEDFTKKAELIPIG